MGITGYAADRKQCNRFNVLNSETTPLSIEQFDFTQVNWIISVNGQRGVQNILSLAAKNQCC